jgi:hypothetical protein
LEFAYRLRRDIKSQNIAECVVCSHSLQKFVFWLWFFQFTEGPFYDSTVPRGPAEEVAFVVNKARTNGFKLA